MKLILTAPVEHLGVPGDIVEVRDGYGRNYLIPQGFAIKATKGAEKQIEGIKRARDAREIRGIDHANQVREQLEALDVVVDVNADATGKLFGAVTPSQVAQAILKTGGPNIDRRAIVIEKPIKLVGKHTVGIQLHEAVIAHIVIDVKSE